jgi:MFS family permease
MSAPESLRPTAAVPWNSPVVRVVLASTLLAPLGVPLVSPTLPVVRDTFGVSDAAASLLISLYFVTGIVLSPFVGMLVDRIGRRVVLVASLLLFGLSGGAVLLVGSFEALLALRVVQGTAATGIFVTTVTIIGDAFDGVQRNAVLGVNTAVLSAGAAAFPVVGGALVVYGWSAPFAAYLLAVPLGVVGWWALADVGNSTGDGTDALGRERVGDYLRDVGGTLVATGASVYYVATFAAELLFFGAILTALPFLLAGRFGLSPLLIGAVLTVTELVAIAASALNGRFARRASNGRLVALGFVCVAVGLVGAWLAPGPALVTVAVTFVGAGAGLVLPSVDAEVSRLVPTRFRAGALSLRNSATFLGRAGGPILFAGLAVYTGYSALLLAAGVASIICAAVVAVATAGVGDSATGTPVTDPTGVDSGDPTAPSAPKS